MNSQSPTQEQLASFQEQISQMQQLMASIQPTQSSAGSLSAIGSVSPAVQPQAPGHSIVTPVPSTSGISAGIQVIQPQSVSVPLTGMITPYQSPHSFQILSAAPQGHPSAMASMPASGTQPFLGFNNIGVSRTGQVNQAQLASSAATQPRPPDLQPRARGPALALSSRPDVQLTMCYRGFSTYWPSLSSS